MKANLFRTLPRWLTGLAIAVVLLAGTAALWMLVVQPRMAVNNTGSTTGVPSGTYSTVTRGDLTLEASATGTLVAQTTYDLSFSADGTVETVNVQVGEKVIAGQTLATLGDVDLLDISVETQQIALRKAQKTLDNLLNGGDTALAAALAAQAEAEEAYQEAFEALRRVGLGRCEKSVTQGYWSTYFLATRDAEFWENALNSGTTGYGKDYIQEQLKPIYERRDQAYVNWKYCEGYSEREIQESEAALQLATAKRDQAQVTYQKLLAESGVDAVQVAIARAQVENATAQLEKAEAARAGVVITAPIDGTVTAVTASAGGLVEAGQTVISLVDPTRMILQTSVDETDYSSFFPGCTAIITFDTLSTRTYSGTVTQVEPVLSSSFVFSTVRGYVTMDNTTANPQKDLPLNLTGTVEVTCTIASDALLIPATALQNAADGSYTVQMVNLLGQTEAQVVEIGKRADMYVEIIAGLSEGQRIVTLPGATTSASVTQ